MLVHVHTNKVRGGQAARVIAKAVIYDQFQLFGVFIRQALDGFFLEHLSAEAPTQVQLTTIDLAVDRQPVAQRSQFALALSGTFCSWCQKWAFASFLLCSKTAIKLPQIIEGNPWLWKYCQRLLCLLIAKITQGTKA